MNKKRVENIIQDKKFIKTVKPRNDKQKEYIEAIRNFPITIGVGSAGSGKSYIAVSEATIDYDANKINKIILLRPAVPSENIGFLPGTLEEKMDPYLRPLFDALYDRWGPDKVNKLIENYEIEVAAIAFCKGRTWNNCFVILDEAQDTTIEQMKLCLTRIGEYCTMIITGDSQQSDIQGDNGLIWAAKKLEKCPSVKVVTFRHEDVVRSEIVKELLEYI